MNFIVELSVTEKCNLACPYCYVANRDQFMTREAFDKALEDIEFYSKKAGCDRVHISYFGGEPLLNWELIKYAIPKVNAKGWSQIIISNMTLITQEIADFCKSHNVRFSWSFDGIDANTSRPLLKIPENQGFKKILDLYNTKKDLILSLCRGCKVMIYPGNYKHMTENLDFFLEWGIPSPDYSIVRDAIWNEEDVKGFKAEAHRLADHWMDLMKQGVRCGVGFFELYIADTVSGVTFGKRPYGCFSCTHGCSVTPDGEFYPCARFASKRILKYDCSYDFKYYAGLLDVRDRPDCKACELYHICNAGCVYSELREGNRPVPAMCDLFRILYYEAARVTHEMKDNPIFQGVITEALNING